MTRWTVLLLGGAMCAGACGDGGTAGDAGAGGSDSGGGGDAAIVDGGARDDGGARGCASAGGAPCEGSLMCCSGVPYPAEGVCMADCPLDSDRAVKERFVAIDRQQILDRVSNLSITEWSYRREPAVRHLGPTAQDFHASFGLGNDDRHIHPVDGIGISLAAIAALRERLDGLAAENARLRVESARLRARVERLERRRRRR
jgi:hypothetical protein